MKEKTVKSLRSLSDSFHKARSAVRQACDKGWNKFCKVVYGGISRFANLLRKGHALLLRGAEAIGRSKAAVAVRGWFSGLWNSRPIRAVRTKTAELREKIKREAPSAAETQSSKKKSPVERMEDGGLSVEAIENELRREKFKHRYSGLLRSTVYALIVTAAAAALIATLLLPVLQIYGSSMTPTLHEGDIVVSVKTSTYEYGDICSFYYSNRILVKRVIGKPLDRIDIDDDGNVYVNGKMIDEPYIKEKAKGECDIEFPFRVPEGSYFMIGDHRLTSIDSRSSTIGCISREEIVGKILFTVWPPKHIGVKS